MLRAFAVIFKPLRDCFFNHFVVTFATSYVCILLFHIDRKMTKCVTIASPK